MSRWILPAAALFIVPCYGFADELWTGDGIVVTKMHVALRTHSPQTITEVLAETGAKVKKGDVLIRFDDRQARIDLQIAQLGVQKKMLELKEAEAKLNEAKDDAKAEVESRRAYTEKLKKVIESQANTDFQLEEQARAKQILVKNDGECKQRDCQRQSQMQSLERKTASSRIDVETAKANVAAAEIKFELFTIRAPFDGVVVTVAATPGEFVAKSEQPLMEVIGGPYHVQAAVPDRLAPSLKVGKKVEIEADKEFADKAFKGTISLVSPVLDPRNRSVNVQISLPPEVLSTLRPGLVVKVHVPLKEDH